MSECMAFPKEWEKFIEDYSFKDKEEVYTNGTVLVPVFRVEQMVEHYFGNKWVPVSERLPEEKTYVLISCGGNVHVARIEMGIDERIRDAMKRGELSDPIIPSWSASTGYTWVKRSMLYSSCDVHGNNLVPYCWYSNYGPGKWFGQEVSHWMLLPEPPKEDV